VNTRTPASRIAALFAAVAITALVVGSQLGIAAGYAAKANAVLAAKRTAPVAQNAGPAALQAPRI